MIVTTELRIFSNSFTLFNKLTPFSCFQLESMNFLVQNSVYTMVNVSLLALDKTNMHAAAPQVLFDIYRDILKPK